MRSNKIISLVFAICALAVMLLISLTACQGGGLGFGTTASKASLSEAKMCKSVDLETGEPIEVSDTFTSDTQWIFCSVKVSNAAPETKIGAEWLYVQDEAGGETNYLIADWNTTTEGTHYIPLSIARPENGWPKGDYKIVLYLNDKETLGVPFKVQ